MVGTAWTQAQGGGAAGATTAKFVATSAVTADRRGRRRRFSPTSTTSRRFCRSRFRGRMLAINREECVVSMCRCCVRVGLALEPAA
jgi:hypothetical protein